MGGEERCGGGDEEKSGGGKKKPLILPSQQTANGVPACQFHWAGEVEHCSVSDLHSVYYAITGASRPRGGLLNSNMHGAALSLSQPAERSLLLSPVSNLPELNKSSREA